MTPPRRGYTEGIGKDVLPKRYASPRLVAHGAMGEVYRATDSVLQRTVAVKLLAERFARDSEGRARFRREALAAARLSGHRHVVTIFDVGEQRGRPLIVMEYHDGGSVHDRLRRGAVSCDQALEWIAQTAAALDHAHAHGIVHRDVKPANLLLDRDGNVHVTDFGIASASGLDTLTEPGTVLGTAGYLSPEQARGEPATPASDRYALAVVAFELLTGSRPFAADTAVTEALGHVHAPVPSAAAFDPALPARVDAVLARGLSKDPESRPASGAELVAELRAAFEGSDRTLTPTRAYSQPRIESAPGTRHADPLPTRKHRLRVPHVTIARRPVGRRYLPAAAVLVACVVVAALLAAASNLGDNARRPTEGADANATRVESAREPASSTDEASDGVELNDAGYTLMQAGDYERALPLLRRAVIALRGSGLLDEAYASYNLAFARFAVGRCDGVIGLLDRSERIQGERREIDELRAAWETRCGERVVEERDEGKGHGRGKGNGRGKKKGHGD